MRRELVVTFSVDSRLDDDRLARQFVAVYEAGTAPDALGEGMHTDNNPRLISVEVRRPARRRRPRLVKKR